MSPPTVEIVDLGRMAYAPALDAQRAAHAEVLAWRDRPDAPLGRVLLVEHDPVVTVTRRPAAAAHVLAPPAVLERAGIELAETDRGGDVTYHGPGQLVAYPIIDLNRAGLRLHDYMRLLEQTVIDTVAAWGVAGRRDPDATGVWVDGPGGRPAKICAMGVRVRRWVSMHGLALNVTTNLDHFGLIVPCGLVGRPVTSLEHLLGPDRCPPMKEVQRTLTGAFIERLAGVRAGATAG